MTAMPRPGEPSIVDKTGGAADACRSARVAQGDGGAQPGPGSFVAGPPSFTVAG